MDPRPTGGHLDRLSPSTFEWATTARDVTSARPEPPLWQRRLNAEFEARHKASLPR